MSIIYTGQPAPLDGMRRLTGREASQRANAIACVRSQSPHCQGQVYVGMFFDGTGNNDAWVEAGTTQTQRARNKHSNVARLYDAHVDDAANGIFRYYVPGIGTPFKDIGDTTELLYDKAGMGFGYMGADRINFGLVSILNAIHRYVTGEPAASGTVQRALISTVSVASLGPLSENARRWAAFKELEQIVAAKVRASQRKVLELNVSIFGFSRGAAEARAFAFWLSQLCTESGGQRTLAGVPLRVGFMGLFDTVASVGLGDMLPFVSGHMAWADGTQSVHPLVEDCAHFIALHEQRASFPLEAAVGRGNIGYPGMHSDVGGGYFPGEQGKAMPEWDPDGSPHLSQIPLIDMHFAAIKGGVAMMTIDEIKAKKLVAASFSTDARLITAYNSWLTTCGIGGGDIRAVTEAHTRQYIRWRGLLHAGGPRDALATKAFYKRASSKDQFDLGDADQQFGVQLKTMKARRDANASTWGSVKQVARTVIRWTTPLGQYLVDPGKIPLTSSESMFLDVAIGSTPLPAGCIGLFEDYAHDSRAGFRPMGLEPICLTGGYLRYRHVFKEEIHSESQVYNWANRDVAFTVAVDNAIASFFVDLWKRVTSIYGEVRGTITSAAITTAAAAAKASKAYQDAETRVLRLAIDTEEQLYRDLASQYQEYQNISAGQGYPTAVVPSTFP